MSFEKYTREHIRRLRTMGLVFILLGTLCSATTYYLPLNETTYWLSREGKEGFYVLSAFFCFLGLYCLGSIWRKRHFI
jgi:hypothetical protein